MEEIARIRPLEGDDEHFLATVHRIIDATDVEPSRAQYLVFVRIKNWFDDKWLGFSGKGRIPFDPTSFAGPFKDHPGVSLTSFRQDKLTFPPFTPNRVIGEMSWSMEEGDHPRRIHRRRFEHSAANLNRRVADFSSSLDVFWISSNTVANGRGSLMCYRARADGALESWYVSFRREGESWVVDRVKSIARERIVSMIKENAA